MVRNLFKKISESFVFVLFKLIGFLPPKDLIYFESFHGKQVSDNPLAIYDALKNIAPDVQLVWGAQKGQENNFRKAGVAYVTRYSFSWFLTMPRASAWVINTRTSLLFSKNSRIFYVQTWHGTPLKKIGLDIPEVKIPGYKTSTYQSEFKAESSRWDLLVAPNSYCEKIFQRAFGFEGDIINVGYPRNDNLVAHHSVEQQVVAKSIKETLSIPLTKKIVLYAPTWRENQRDAFGNYQFDLALDVEKLLSQLDEEVVLLTRMHYLVRPQASKEPNNNIIDVSTYSDMKDLLLISDVLITDYSSSFFDFAIMQRPIIFYLPDQAEYEEDLRGLYFPIEGNVPGEIARNPEELTALLNGYLVNPDSLIPSNYLSFFRTYCEDESGQAAQIVATIINENRRVIT